MQHEKLQAFVLSHSEYGERDLIVSLFTLEHGRLKGFARSARNSRKRFGPALEPLARIEVQIQVKDGLSSLSSADVLTLHPGIRANLSAIAHGLYACELVDALTPEGVALPRLYRLLATYLEHLDGGNTDSAGRRMFEINMLNILGYRPSLDSCSRCGAEFDSRGALMQQGGELVCRFCAATGRPISRTVLSHLGLCLSTGRFGMLAVDQDSLVSVSALLDEAIAVHCSRRLKSLAFLNQTSE
jgi:DNA repair protein RecO (recombination protein O)